MNIESFKFNDGYPRKSLMITIKDLLKNGALTRDQMVKALDIPRTTIYDSLKVLIKLGIVVKYPEFKPERNRGRPKILFALKDD